MAFFKKLKEKLFKSSSRIDEGLEAIVSEGGEAEAVDAVDQIEAQAEIERAAAEQAQAAAATRAAQDAEDARLAAEAAREAEEAEAVRVAEEARLEAAAQAARERASQEAAKAQAASDARAQEESEAAEAAAQELAAEKAAAQARTAAEEEAQIAAEARAAEKARAQEAAEAETAAKVQAEADAKAKAEAASLRASLTPVAPVLDKIPEPAPQKPGLLGRLMGRAAPAQVVRRVLDDDMLEQLEELLIAADMGVDTASRVTANMAEGRYGKKLSVAEIKRLMADEIARIMEPVARPLPLYSKTPQVVLVVGVNGSGKTTTIGKLASQFRAAGKNVVIAAGDTFRAAAVEQLQVWGERAGVPVLTAPQGSDPASLAFDAMGKAEADGADLLLIDTAGRLQNRGDLMEELAKIVRVIRKKDPTAPHNTLLVLDATTGQNALNQVKVFQEISDVSGLVMTKLDGTAKGGVLVALADKFGLPIHAIGVGEQIDDLDAFDPQEFADALTGFER